MRFVAGILRRAPLPETCNGSSLLVTSYSYPLLVRFPGLGVIGAAPCLIPWNDGTWLGPVVFVEPCLLGIVPTFIYLGCDPIQLKRVGGAPTWANASTLCRKAVRCPDH